MKHTFLQFVLLCFFSVASIAQESCKEHVEELKILTDNNQLHEAYAVISSADCLLKADAAFDNVEKVLIYKIESAANSDEKQKQLDVLLNHYDNYDFRHPGNDKGNKLKKVVALKRFSEGSENDIFKILDSEFKRDFKNFNDAGGIALYFDLYFAKFTAKEKGFTEHDLFEKHDILLTKLEQLSHTDPDNARDYQTAASGISALMSPIATCEKLEVFYHKNYEANKNQVDWLEQASNGLKTQQCLSSKMFMKVANQWYNLEKSSASAMNLATAYSQTRERAKAVEYYKIAADLQKDPIEQSKIYQSIATALVGSNKIQALDFAQKAIAANPNNGKAYLLLAQLYSAAEDCGKTTVEKKAVYILASKTALMAGQKDPYLKATADRQSELFLRNAPTPDEIRQENKAGKIINYNCWFKASVALP
ncbi:MAG: tetratricopeptide repeat protein [Flavobacterium sp.]|nr:tetratricopeptide repeat protein [Flavobacterium sp.]